MVVFHCLFHAPLVSSNKPRLLWASQQSGFLASVVRQRVSMSVYIPACRQVRKTSTGSTMAANP